MPALSHLLFEQTVWPQGGEWLAVVAMGLGPVGAAFFAWDIGMKQGDIRALGACGYLTPLLSTALLVAFGRAEPSWVLAAAALLIAGGARSPRGTYGLRALSPTCRTKASDRTLRPRPITLVTPSLGRDRA